MNHIVILDNIRSVFNVGSIFRSSEGAGVKKIYLCGITPTPLDRFGAEREDINKTALGTQKQLEWEYFEKTEDAIKKLKDTHKVVSVEQTKQAMSHKDFKCEEYTAFVFGSEVDGVSKNILSESDAIIQIKMKGKKESLNVASVAGIILFHFTD
ncbi:MAG: TrmH family RNA methyltransferase [Candidatus Campbellbacteria bacterium]|nr:TrmH family RNA methyltransferase [Candidatus Campbellbacteria bacterium]